ncbi:hypothetical protein J4221_05125 [Candidatus Pacearchaeota archaeon]|nr:hypothetical protein [Candidatus Pacearchaeota archaeon]
MINNEKKSIKKGTEKGVKIIILSIVFTLILFLSLSYVSAYKWACLTKGQSVPNDEDPRYTCEKDHCRLCLTDTNYPTSFSKCNGLNVCSTFDGDGVIDSEPPVLNISSPINNEVYSSRNVLFSITINEPAMLYYTDNINGRGRWKRIQGFTKSYNRGISFSEGLNNITIKGEDKHGNTAEYVIVFNIDSREPVIKRTTPERGFVNSVFNVEYDEENVEKVMLHYGTENNMKELTLNNCPSGRRVSCSVEVDLSEFDGQEIMYWFHIIDIAGGEELSKEIIIAVDYSKPIIQNLNHMANDKKVTFFVEYVEPFLDEILYRYTDGRGKEREKRLCSKAGNGVCEDDVRFNDGEYEVDIIVKDKAGNEAFRTTNFLIDSKDPRIKRTFPDKKFADGLFEIEFDEDNPSSLLLHYGTPDDMRTSEINLGECTLDKFTFCSKIVDLDDFESREISYWFELIDIVGNTALSRAKMLKVDTTAPVLNNDNFWTLDDKGYVQFMFDVTEENFGEISYTDQSESRPRERRLCSRLVNGLCNVKKRFIKGHHVVDIKIMDEAGNAISERIEFDVV